MAVQELKYLGNLVADVRQDQVLKVQRRLEEVVNRRSPARLATETGIHPDDVLIQDIRTSLSAALEASKELGTKMDKLHEDLAAARRRFRQSGQ